MNNESSYTTRQRRTNYVRAPALRYTETYWEEAFSTRSHRGSVQRKPRITKPLRVSRLVVISFDVFVCLYFVKSLQVYIGSQGSTIIRRIMFQNDLQNTPTCDDIDPDEVDFTLAIHLSDDHLLNMEHHCLRWGISAPISIAVWTSLQEEDILQKLETMGCHREHVTVQIFNHASGSQEYYPINALRNLALTGVTTSHVLSVDVDFWESNDLYDTLNTPNVRKELSKDPKLGIVVPSFEIQNKCQGENDCKVRSIPRDFEELVMALESNEALPYDAVNFWRQGSTDYRTWMKQRRGELVDISCVSSDQYQPYLVVRLCDAHPPYQEQFLGRGRNHMAWMIHLRRLGYRLQQIGGSFLTHFPGHSSDDPKEKADDVRRTFIDYRNWLEINVADNSVLAKCGNFENDDYLVLVNTPAGEISAQNANIKE